MKPFVIFVFVLIMVCFAGSGLARPQSAEQGKWSEKARLPEPRGEVAAASVNGKIYVMGGSARGRDDQQLVEEYAPATDRWRERAPIPRGISHAGAVGMNGKIYVVGGFTRNVHMGALDVAFEYDPGRDTWRTLAPMKSPRGSVGLAALNGKLHAIGGRGLDTVTVATHEVYDPATNSWKSAAPMPTPRSAMAVTLYRGLILVAGGECNNGKTFVENEGYDPKTDRWQILTPMMPTGRHGFRAASVGNYAYFPGGARGCGGGAISDTMLVFSLP